MHAETPLAILQGTTQAGVAPGPAATWTTPRSWQDQCRFFRFAPPEGERVGFERLVATGTTAVEKSLDHLHMDSKHDFASVLDPARRGIIDHEDDYPPPELWTSARATLRVQRR